MAGRLGRGGGGGPPLCPLRPRRAPAPGEGARDPRRARVPVRPGPGSAHEVAEAEPLLRLPVGPLAGPARLDGAGRASWDRRRPAGSTGGTSPRRTSGARPPPEPPRRPGAGCPRPGPPGGTFGDPDAPTGEAGGGRTPGASAPTRHPPARARARRLGGPAESVGDVSFARASSSGGREDRRDADRVDLQGAWNAHGPGRPSRTRAPAEGSAEPVARVGRNAAEPHAGGPHAVDPPERDLGPAPEAAPPGGRAGPVETGSVRRPAPRRDRPEGDRRRPPRPRPTSATPGSGGRRSPPAWRRVAGPRRPMRPPSPAGPRRR